jgi:hypothetical protein
MKCPHCGHHHSRVTDTKRVEHGTRRYRICAKCRQRFATLERIEEWDPGLSAYAVPDVAAPAPLRVLEAAPEPELAVASIPAPESPKPKPATTRHDASLDDERLVYVAAEVRPLLVQWWNESRRSKHRGNATWTRAAWEASVQRISNLPTHLQVELCQAGVEHGWQALKLEYIQDKRSPATVRTDGRLLPQDPRLLEAIRLEHEAEDLWPAAS